MGGVWCTYRGENHLSSHVQPCSLFWFFFCLKEQKERWSSPQRRHLSKATTPQSCSTQVSLCLCFALGALVTDLGRVVAGWWGGFRVQPRVHLCLVSRPKSPKPLPCAGFSGHAGQPSCSCSPATTQLGGSVAEASLPHYLSHRAMLPAQNPFPLSLPWGWSWLQLVPGAWLLLPGGCRLRWWCWHGFRQMAAG